MRVVSCSAAAKVVALLALSFVSISFLLAPARPNDCAPGFIETVAGGEAGDGSPGTEASLQSPYGLAVGPDGSLYVADTFNHRIRKVDLQGIMTTIAGTGDRGYEGDGGPARQASLNEPRGVALRPDGSVYIADTGNHRIRKVDRQGIITTVAGDGPEVQPPLRRHYSGDGGPATEAHLHAPCDVAVAADGTLYIADSSNNRIRKVDVTGIITTVAGRGQAGDKGDGGPATEANLRNPGSVVIAPDGSLYITQSHRVREVDPQGIITTVVGGERGSYGGDGGPAIEATLHGPVGLALGPDGSLYIADSSNSRIRKVDPAGIITTVAGNGERGFSGDGGPAIEAAFDWPYDVAAGADGSLYVVDLRNHRIRKVHPNGNIATVAGVGWQNNDPKMGRSVGDGRRAIDATLHHPSGVALGADGSIYIADGGNRRIRRVDPAGVITTVAGSGATSGVYGGRVRPAVEAYLGGPTGVTVGPDGSLYIADVMTNLVQKIDKEGVISTVAGGGGSSFRDGVLAVHTGLNHPTSVQVAPDGTLYIADSGNHRIRKVSPAGMMTTVAGCGLAGRGAGSYSGDGGPATEATLNRPHDVALAPDGSLYIADYGSNRVRKVDPHGVITTVVGSGKRGYSGDGGPATQASLNGVRDVAVAPDGTIYVADEDNHRIRKVNPQGVITTVAGDGRLAEKRGLRLEEKAEGRYSGDGGAATQASLNRPRCVAVSPDGSLLIADTGNHRVRKVCGGQLAQP